MVEEYCDLLYEACRFVTFLIDNYRIFLADLMKEMTLGVKTIPSDLGVVLADQIPSFFSSIIETTHIFH